MLQDRFEVVVRYSCSLGAAAALLRGAVFRTWLGE